ncbi:MAG: hypothetical protein CVV11_20065 [Gammaproteobacteria bacterium HGW-Gammaproteobacteria-15]|nr:MAG: hypothetical protein CVV11_20065 [Gammaproteobacteria bacterium HGW-Gammaproteobacteria-15]
MLQRKVLILQLILQITIKQTKAAILAACRFLLGQPYKTSFQTLIVLPANLILEPLMSILGLSNL